MPVVCQWYAVHGSGWEDGAIYYRRGVIDGGDKPAFVRCFCDDDVLGLASDQSTAWLSTLTQSGGGPLLDGVGSSIFPIPGVDGTLADFGIAAECTLEILEINCWCIYDTDTPDECVTYIYGTEAQARGIISSTDYSYKLQDADECHPIETGLPPGTGTGVWLCASGVQLIGNREVLCGFNCATACTPGTMPQELIVEEYDASDTLVATYTVQQLNTSPNPFLCDPAASIPGGNFTNNGTGPGCIPHADYPVSLQFSDNVCTYGYYAGGSGYSILMQCLFSDAGFIFIWMVRGRMASTASGVPWYCCVSIGSPDYVSATNLDPAVMTEVPTDCGPLFDGQILSPLPLAGNPRWKLLLP